MGTQTQRDRIHTQMTMQTDDNSMEFQSPLCSPGGIRERLNAFGLTPNRALGQNFLADEGALNTLLDAMRVENLPVLEIGPGLGALTQGLLSRASRVVAVEKDAAMVRVLEKTLNCDALTLIEGDILRVDFSELHAKLGGGEFVVAGNLPYYITTPIVLLLLSCGLPIQSMTLMLQQEAALRFFAQPGERVYGPLTVAAACAYTAGQVMTLPPSAYYPQPDVHSAVVRLSRRGAPVPNGFVGFLQGVFAMRRKTLLNNLLAMGYARGAVQQTLASLSLPAGIRAEALPPETLLRLYQAFGC